jgi:hypothetical protein
MVPWSSFFDPDGRARDTGRRYHPLPFGGKDPEGDEFSRIDLLLDFDNFQVDRDLIGVTITVKISAQGNSRLRGARDRGFHPLLNGNTVSRNKKRHK